MSAVKDPIFHEIAHRFAGGRFQSRPQVGVVGVSPEVVRQIAPDTVSEGLLAEELLQHPDHCGTLLVGQDVKHGFGVGRRDHRVLDGAGGG